MSVKYLRCLADFYGVTTDYLLGRTETKTIDEDVATAIKTTGLSAESINTLKFTDDEHLQRRTEVLNAIIVRPWILDALHAYLYLNIDRVAKWDEEARAEGKYKTTDNYEWRVALADSKQGKTVSVDAATLGDALLLKVEGELRELKEGLMNGKH